MIHRLHTRVLFSSMNMGVGPNIFLKSEMKTTLYIIMLIILILLIFVFVLGYYLCIDYRKT